LRRAFAALCRVRGWVAALAGDAPAEWAHNAPEMGGAGGGSVGGARVSGRVGGPRQRQGRWGASVAGSVVRAERARNEWGRGPRQRFRRRRCWSAALPSSLAASDAVGTNGEGDGDASGDRDLAVSG
jgi:hypothetical protein